ncbi:uncharacterized protein LOC144744544 [Ciona intestinalis]
MFRLLMLVLFVCVCYGNQVRYRRNEKRCRIPLNTQNRKQCRSIMEQAYVQYSYKLSRFDQSALKNSKMGASTPKCPTMTESYVIKENSPTARSTAPYVTELVYDNKRIPRYLPQSKCLCSGCIASSNGRETLVGKSMPLVAQIKVMRRNKTNSYSVVTEDVTIGCTCMLNV